MLGYSPSPEQIAAAKERLRKQQETWQAPDPKAQLLAQTERIQELYRLRREVKSRLDEHGTSVWWLSASIEDLQKAAEETAGLKGQLLYYEAAIETVSAELARLDTNIKFAEQKRSAYHLLRDRRSQLMAFLKARADLAAAQKGKETKEQRDQRVAAENELTEINQALWKDYEYQFTIDMAAEADQEKPKEVLGRVVAYVDGEGILREGRP